MFKVKSLGQDKPELKPVCSGITFGFLEKELVFEVTSDSIPIPLRVSFYVKTDKSKKDYEFEIGKIIENSLTLSFYNPSKSGSSGLKLPMSVIRVDRYLLGFMFRIETLLDTDCYQLAYEFYDGLLPETGGVA